jgi:hypothetical protein
LRNKCQDLDKKFAHVAATQAWAEKQGIPMPEQSPNRGLDFSRERELAKNLKTRIPRVWNSLRRIIRATDELSRSLDNVLAEVECVVSTTAKRQETNCRPANLKGFRFFDEGCPELERVISAVIEQEPGKNEIYRKPSELLEVARTVTGLSLKIADVEPALNKDKRAERAALGRYCELYKGRTFNVKIGDQEMKINFDAIGNGRTRVYRFTKRAE